MRKHRYTCGHVAESMCAECYARLANRVDELTVENQLLRDALNEADATIVRILDDLKGEAA